MMTKLFNNKGIERIFLTFLVWCVIFTPCWQVFMTETVLEKTKQILPKADAGEKSIEEMIDRLFGLNSSYLFHTPDNEPYAVIKVNNHFEIWPILTYDFKLLLARRFFQKTGKLPCKNALDAGLEKLKWMALLIGQKQEVFNRIIKLGDAIYIDLVNSEWEQVEITGDGWNVIPCIESPARFIRQPGMLELPRPVKGGSLEMLRPFINTKNEESFILIVSWLLGAMNPNGPFPVLIINGVQGALKSTVIKILRSCIDPSVSISRSLPKSERDLQISARKSLVQTFDNLTSIPKQIADALCRLSSGGGLATRKLYTDDIEVILNACRPIILAGISNFTTQNDLLDRAIVINLPHMPDKKRRPESEIMDAWKCEIPRILGALCDAVSTALNNFDKVKLEAFPRMADFARFIVAAEQALPWENGMFLKAYENNRAELIDIAIEVDPVGTSVLEFIKKHNEWRGTHSDLLDTLECIVPPRLQKLKEWPKSPNILSNRLMKLEAFLNEKGVKIERERRANERIITLLKIDDESQTYEDEVI